jgi:hypothetical protein
MNFANPYAAPQTVESAIDLRKLPMATLASSGMLRRALPVVSTKELARLVKQSRALKAMQLVWMWLSPLLLLGVFLWLCVEDFDNGTPINYIPLAIGVAVCLARLVLGHGRSRAGRYVGLIVDSLLIAACVVGMTLVTQHWFDGKVMEQVSLVVCLLMLFFPLSFGFHALVAMLEARVLFGGQRCRHQELLEELGYRQDLGIE